MDTKPYYKEIISRIDALSKKEYANTSLVGLQLCVIGVIQIFIIASFLEMIFNFSSLIRTIIALLFLAISSGLLAYLFIRPFLKYLNISSRKNYLFYAKKVGLSFPIIKDELLNAMQLVKIPTEKNTYSSELVDAAFQQMYLKTKSINFLEAVNYTESKRISWFSTATLITGIFLLFFVPGLNSASYRLINFNKDFIPPARFGFIVSPGNKDITKGMGINITIRVTGQKPADVSIGIKYVEQTDYEFKTLQPDSSGLYSFNIPSVRSSFTYIIKAEEVESALFKITVIDKPIIKSMDVTITPPQYSKLPVINQKDNGNVSSLIGSQIQFFISTTKENLKSAELFLNDSTHFQLKNEGKNVIGTYRIKKDESYKIIITDKEGNQNENPVSYSIKALPDNYPAIEFVSPNKNVTLAEFDRLPLLVKIADDFGFSKLLLHYRLSSSKQRKAESSFSQLEIPINKSLKDEDINYLWNFSSLKLSEEDIVTYYIEVFDNDNISGPKSARTETFTIRIPSLDELLNNADKTQNVAEQKMSETLREAQKLKDNMEKISQDLKQDKKDITWQEKEKIEKALDKFKELEKKVDDIKKDLSTVKNDLQKNNLLSKETLNKYMELQKLFEEMSSDEMKKAMDKMQDLLQKMNRDQIQNAMEDIKFNEDAMKKSIERTLQLLKRVQIEQKMDEINKRLEQLTKQLEDLKQQTNQTDIANENKRNELADRQQDVTKDFKNLENSMKELRDKMKDFKDMPNETMDNAMKELQNQQNDELSENTQQQLLKGQKQSAEKNQSQLSQNMQQMQKKMSDMQKQMQQQNTRQVFNDMMKVLDNMITLSKEQEELKNKTQQLDPNSSQYSESAKKQNNLQQEMNKITSQLNELSKKTFSITPEMANALGKANQSMQHSTSELLNRNSSQASSQQNKAMQSLNEAATLMKSSMENMLNGGGSGGGMPSLMQQLQNLSQQQMNLNNLTQMMNQGKLSVQQQAELQRLAQQQELIRKSLDQLNNEAKQAGETKKLPANLDKVLNEMQEVVNDLKSQKVNNDLIQKQERILSKLLDAQRSINERDYEKQRESKSGNTFSTHSPADLNLSTKRKDRIKDELNKAVQEGYTKDYENLIRKYYDALQKEKGVN